MKHIFDKIKILNIPCSLKKDEPMAKHTWFKIGGTADVYVVPQNIEQLIKLYSFCLMHNIPCFVLGAGANILVSDSGVRGVVICLDNFQDYNFKGNSLIACAGLAISMAAEAAANRGLSGIDVFYSMPGTIGGSVWINARCYGISVADMLEWVEILDNKANITRIKTKKSDFGYKISPFQKKECIILKACFILKQENKDTIKSRMMHIKADREQKGHFRYPCAGSVFKNNRSFGRPSGQIIDSLKLKGYRIGDAVISEDHANIIVNLGRARANDVRKLIEFVKSKVKKEKDLILEEEIIYVGKF